MDFFKKHYEKVLLGLVLLGLAVGAAFLPLMIAGERQSLEDKRQLVLRKQVKPLPALNLARQEELIKRAEAPLYLDFSTTNKLFNPELWQKTVDGRLIKMPAGGPVNLCQVTRIAPLFTIVSFDNVQTNEPIHYIIGVVREASANPAQRRKISSSAMLNEKKERDGFGFTIREVKGPPDAPTELVLELNDTGERISVTRDKPFRREDGYIADLKYDPEKRPFMNRRELDRIAFGGERYIIVAIHKSEVVLSAESNNKKTSIPYNPGP